MAQRKLTQIFEFCTMFPSDCYSLNDHGNRFSLGWLWVFMIFFRTPAHTQNHAGMMYGKIVTHSSTYEGAIRWGKEETQWLDHFNASKRKIDSYKAYESKPTGDLFSIFELDWDLESIWEDRNPVHSFNCQFGDIKSLKVTGQKTARLQFRNGAEIDVLGSQYNDLGEKITILDKELGLMAIDWNKIQYIDFEPFPRKASVMGEALKGTVETNRRERFTGFIQWDHDERLTTDKLDGNSPDGNISVSFSEIRSIEKKGSACEVIFKSDRTLLVSGSNDVNPSNRGLNVLIPGTGMVDIPWSSFRKVVFSERDESGPGFENFPVNRPLSGTVFTLEDKELTGILVYDFDETLDLETLEGKDNGVRYTIPFRNIRSIRPKNNEFSQIELKTGEQLLLGESHDVSASSGGVLVFQKGKKEPVHIPRKKIDLIVFD